MTYRRRIFTEAEVISARSMRGAGRTWRELGSAFDCDYGTVRRAIEPGYREKRAGQIARVREGRFNSTGAREHVRAKHNFQIPEAVEADRDRRQTAPQSLTSLLCGDPAPGQSALDKRGVA